jgi:methylmalonyl-CoA mutase
MSNQKEKLFTDFPVVSTEEWMAKIVADLKGADFEKKLVWKTNEGFKVNPFYRNENVDGFNTVDSLPGEFPYVRGTKTNNDWFVRHDIKVTDFKATNAKALDILNKGVTSLGFEIHGDDVTLDNIKTLLNGIHPEAVELNFSTCGRHFELVQILADYLKSTGADLTKCFGSVNFNPFKPLLRKGRDCTGWVKDAAQIVTASAVLPRFRVLNVDAYLLNDSGAFSYQELGYALANGNTLLAELVEAGLEAALVAKKIKFNFGVGSNYFMEIAKFRAARWLWAEIVKAYNPVCTCENCPNKKCDGICLCSAKMYIHAQTSTYNTTVFDAHVNLLRSQTESMSATIAGINSLTVRPFDIAYKSSDDFSERIARNQQLLLKEECHFDKVTDASAGSYYVENLTVSLAEQAWELFLAADEKGFYEELKAGTVQDAVKASSGARFKNLATRREVLLGTNQFPNFTEVAGGKIVADGSCGCEKSSDYKALPVTRLAADFEKLRLATEKSGKTPVVFMLTIGNLAMRLARSQFSSNFFACAGYQIIDNLGFQTVEEGVKAAREKKADIIVLCSSDDEYATLAPEAYELVKGKELFVVAGAPACSDDLKALGIEYFVNVRSNVLETLQQFNKLLNI